MKRYGANWAASYSRADVDALVQEFVVGKALAKKLYAYASYYGHDDGGYAREADRVMQMIDIHEDAQAWIDSYQRRELAGKDNSKYDYVPYEPAATFSQISYLKSLIKKAGGHYDGSIYDLTKKEASQMIDELLGKGGKDE